jgi:hypothetical protein
VSIDNPKPNTNLLVHLFNNQNLKLKRLLWKYESTTLGPVCSCFSAGFLAEKLSKLKAGTNGKLLTGFWNVEKQVYEEIN